MVSLFQPAWLITYGSLLHMAQLNQIYIRQNSPVIVEEYPYLNNQYIHTYLVSILHTPPQNTIANSVLVNIKTAV